MTIKVHYARIAHNFPTFFSKIFQEGTFWKEGEKVRDADIPKGTAIATFSHGVYHNFPGNHAAIYVSQDEHGIIVWDQWVGQPVHKRLIQFRGGDGPNLSNDGDAFSVIET